MRNRLRRTLAAAPSPASWTFFRQWLKSPLSIAAISPSSRQLARQMIAEMPPGARRVVELGGGTGVFTQALIDHGIAPRDLMVLELNEELHHHLKRRFQEAYVVCADARDLPEVVERTGYAQAGPVDAVLSGLGLLSMHRSTQLAIAQAAFSVMAPEGRLIQFTYGPGCPIHREVLDELSLHARRGSLTWWNMPPATVWVVQRRRSRSIAPKSMR